MPDQPTLGRIVRFVLQPVEDDDTKGAHRPAVVVDVTLEGVSLQVFTAGETDRRALPLDARWGEAVPALVARHRVPYDESAKPGTWHWPPKEGKRT